MSRGFANPLQDLARVRVGTRNEPKLEAVASALRAYAPAVAIEGSDVASGVPEQPLGFPEITRGARNRAERARASGACDLGIGIEDGLVELPGGDAAALAHVNVGCAAVTDGERVSVGFSSGFAYPPACTGPAVGAREPIGPLFDAFWQRHRGERPVLPSGRTTGNVGVLTSGVLPRSEYARHAVLCALVPFLHPDLYVDEGRA